MLPLAAAEPLPLLTTKRVEPETAIPAGRLRPVRREALSVAPELEYRLTVPASFCVTNMLDPETATPRGRSKPFTSAALTVAPPEVKTPSVPVPSFTSKMFCALAAVDSKHG